LAQVSPARKIAFEILLQVDAVQSFASDLLQDRRVSALSERDRGLATEIIMGVLRWRGEIDHRLHNLSGRDTQTLDPEVATALRMGIFQIAFLEKIPKSAAVNESVELTKLSRKRSAAGLVNAVLRKCLPEKLLRAPGSGFPNDAEMLGMVRRSVPLWMLNRWETNFGSEAANRLAWAATKVPSTTLRICTPTPDPDEVADRLLGNGCNVRRGKYGSNALIVEASEGTVSRLAEVSGLVIQDEASQLVPELLQVHPGECALDLCAAPGMKTSLLADAIGNGLVVASDASARRLQTLRKLLPRLTANSAAVQIVRLDATQPLPFRQQFDRILVDAPCSGTGTLARNPEIKWRLNPEDPNRLSAIQRQILSNTLPTLRPGGRLVYATCSVEPEENETVVEDVLAANADCHLVSPAELAEGLPRIAPLIDDRGYFHTRPDLHGMDGFFAAVITR
jgi:16S rRNA (cytosine967-C5)-methyltransferase